MQQAIKAIKNVRAHTYNNRKISSDSRNTLWHRRNTRKIKLHLWRSKERLLHFLRMKQILRSNPGTVSCPSTTTTSSDCISEEKRFSLQLLLTLLLLVIYFKLLTTIHKNLIFFYFKSLFLNSFNELILKYIF